MSNPIRLEISISRDLYKWLREVAKRTGQEHPKIAARVPLEKAMRDEKGTA